MLSTKSWQYHILYQYRASAHATMRSVSTRHRGAVASAPYQQLFASVMVPAQIVDDALTTRCEQRTSRRSSAGNG
eukprot:2051427-Rhodomonas_salina.3